MQLPARVVLDTLRIEGLTAGVIRGPQGKLEPLELLPKPAKPRGKPAPPWSAAVSEATVDGETKVSFRDLSVEPNVVLHLSKLRVKLSRIDSAEPKQTSPVAIHTRIGKYSSLGATGTISPFGPKLSADLGADLASLSLPPLNGYIGELIGYQATSGRLDMKLRLGVRGGRIDGTAHATPQGAPGQGAAPAAPDRRAPHAPGREPQHSATLVCDLPRRPCRRRAAARAWPPTLDHNERPQGPFPPATVVVDDARRQTTACARPASCKDVCDPPRETRA